jgi:hypothetical protein
MAAIRSKHFLILPGVVLLTLFLWNFCIAQPPPAKAPTVLTMCYLIEKNTMGANYDYNRAAAALDLAKDYANDYVLSDEIKLISTYRNIGSTCGFSSHIIGHALKLQENGINCSVYIGPGRLRLKSTLMIRMVPISSVRCTY